VSPRAAFALGVLAGAAALLSISWAAVAWDAWTADHQRPGVVFP
jgi:hypothetical protein